MNTPEPWFSAVPLVALAIPALLGLTAVVAPRRAGLASLAAWGLTLLFVFGALGGGSSMRGVRVDAVTCVMLLLVTSLGAIVVRYSWTSLHGDPGLERYLRWLLLTLSAVTGLVIADNLLVVALGWTSTSLALHQLLTFFGHRAPALVAAHKKFLVSRLADVFLLGCLGLISREVGSLDFDRIAAWANLHPQLTPSMHVAAVCLVIAVALKSAQLPFHGWLTQVMEAPTPVSALLHAGIVNLGGFVLIRLAPMMAHAGPAQFLLVVIGLTSAIVGALVMTTRVSVKVALAWSTCAQMGFMLVQCGLGLWHLALLHLAAHSLYKAHAFLSAGTAVQGWLLGTLTPRAPLPAFGRLALAVLGAAACVATFSWFRPDDLSGVLLALLLSLAVVPLLAQGTLSAPTAVRIAGLVVLWVGWHAAAALLIRVPTSGSNLFGWALVACGFSGLFLVKAVLQRHPEGKLARAWYPWLFAGLYLDERFTRVTFKIWPPRLQGPAAFVGPRVAAAALEGQS